MDLVTTLIENGVFGIVAGVTFYLYLTERSAHKDTLTRLEKVMADRVEDSKENLEKVTGPLNVMSMGIQALSDKIEIARRQ